MVEEFCFGEAAEKVVTVDYGCDVGDLFVRERGSHRNNRHNNPLKC